MDSWEFFTQNILFQIGSNWILGTPQITVKQFQNLSWFLETPKISFQNFETKHQRDSIFPKLGVVFFFFLKILKLKPPQQKIVLRLPSIFFPATNDHVVTGPRGTCPKTMEVQIRFTVNISSVSMDRSNELRSCPFLGRFFWFR